MHCLFKLMWMSNYHFNCLLHHTSWKVPSLTKFDRYVFISLAIPLQYFVLAPVTTALCLMLTVVTAGKPDLNTQSVCFTCLFSQESHILPSILPPPSVFYCLQHRAAETREVRWGWKHKKTKCGRVCVCVCVCVCVPYVCSCNNSVAKTNASTVCLYSM